MLFYGIWRLQVAACVLDSFSCSLINERLPQLIHTQNNLPGTTSNGLESSSGLEPGIFLHTSENMS